MDYTFSITPAMFTADLAAQSIPAVVKAAIQAGWAATDQSKPTYEINAATGDYWTVVRIAAVLTI